MNYRVLVVDDEQSVRRALERSLRYFGYDVVTAAGGDSAYEILAHDHFDAILLDLRMPLMTGDTLFLAIIRRWPELRNRIVIMSGDPSPGAAGWPAELHNCPFLGKPFTFDMLKSVVASVLPQPAERPRLGHGPA